MRIPLRLAPRMLNGASMPIRAVHASAIKAANVAPVVGTEAIRNERVERRRRQAEMLKTLRWLHRNMLVWGGSVDVPDEQKADALINATVVDDAGRPLIMNGYRQTDERTVESDLFLMGELRNMIRDLR
ncbi:hypothetical protein NQ176_g2389 [Zarea fungicola]|uniref:Uncharacterized protein n=1 Tax=Zarea fungicola TaxID=93591 RepID=A0ACC1NPL9_9HYPO|nr:hypothetical protein NQ176_g2389 [Lecanicillium fungicola]